MQEALRFVDVWFRYRSDGPWVLRGVSLTLEPGEWLALMGESGGGKSTIARLACGLAKPSAGEVDAARAGYVAQDPQANIVGERVDEDVSFALAGRAMTSSEIDSAVDAALNAVELAWAKKRRMATLSGGELQRVAVAAALAQGAQLLVLDEPTSHLSTDAARRFWSVAEPALRRAGTAVLLITHRLQEAKRADRISLLGGGRIAVAGPAFKLARRPQLFEHAAVAADPVEAVAGWCERAGKSMPWPTDDERLVAAVCSLLVKSRSD